MKGRSYLYAGQVHKIEKITINEENDKFVITTNLNVFARKFESGVEFLKYWSEVENNKMVVSGPQTVENALADEMIAILRDNIAKVQADPAYVKQAQQINNNVNSIINIVKTKMDFIKQMSKD